MSERDTVRELCGAPTELLLELYYLIDIERQSEVRLATLRARLGSKVYSNAYKLAMLGLVVVTPDKHIYLTNNGKKLAECLYKCFYSHSTNL